MRMSNTTPYQSVPPQVQAAAMKQGAWLEVLQFEQDVTIAKKDAEMREGGEYQRVVNFVKGLLGQVEKK